MEFVPLRFLSKLSAGVPTPARSASVFFTTLYLPPAACTARRSLVSASTVMPWKVERMTVDTLASSVLSLSRSCCFSLRFFIVLLRWLGLHHGLDHRVGVLRQLCALKLDFADGTMDNAGLVHTKFHFAGLDFLDGFGNIKSNRAGFRVGHQPARPQHLAELTGRAHHVWRSDHGIVIRPAFHDLLDDVIAADKI